jgi:hypothetical protein
MPVHMLPASRENGDDVISSAISKVFGPLKEEDEGVARRHTSQLDQGQGPKIMYLENKL